MEATSRLIQAVGRVQIHAVAELRSPFPRWLLAGGCSRFWRPPAFLGSWPFRPGATAGRVPLVLSLLPRALLHLSDSSQRILSVFKDLCE